MKPILFIIFLFASALWFGGTAQAQSKTQGIERSRQLNHYKKSLGLDSVKASKVQAIHENYKKNLQAIVADSTLDLETRKKRVGALIGDKNDQLRKMLSPAQQRKVIPLEGTPSGGKKGNQL